MNDFFELNGKGYRIWRNKGGYLCITIGGRPYYLHRLVYAANHGMIPNGNKIHHIDGDKANWSISNLEVVAT